MNEITLPFVTPPVRVSSRSRHAKLNSTSCNSTCQTISRPPKSHMLWISTGTFLATCAD
ncbi:hypothetical protein B0H19DRAFT_1139551 [Mycena capillaripes]|nr:hypothetical protein B0H19DRAFT_1139551 [Mycena capillaripes]